MKKLKQEQEFIKNRSFHRVGVLVAGVLFLMLALRVVMANWLVEKTEELAAIEDRAVQLEGENEIVRYQLGRQSAMAELMVRARDLGFTEPVAVKFLSGPTVTALAQ